MNHKYSECRNTFEMKFLIFYHSSNIWMFLISSVIKLPLFGVNHENARDQFFALFEFYNPICSGKFLSTQKESKQERGINF